MTETEQLLRELASVHDLRDVHVFERHNGSWFAGAIRSDKVPGVPRVSCEQPVWADGASLDEALGRLRDGDGGGWSERRERLRSDDVLDALTKAHSVGGHQWAVLPELRLSTGYVAGSEQRIDLVAVNSWPSKARFLGQRLPARKIGVISYEVKVSRDDFSREVANPEKRAVARLFSDVFLFATPAGLISPDEVPSDCGLVEVDERGRLRLVRPAPLSPKALPSWELLSAVARRASRAETLLADESA